MLGPYRDLVNVIVDENSESDLRTFVKEIVSPSSPEALLSFPNVKGLNDFFRTQALMFAYGGEHIPYYDVVAQDIKKAFPWLFERIGKLSDYWEYNDLCKVIRDSYKFEAYQKSSSSSPITRMLWSEGVH